MTRVKICKRINFKAFIENLIMKDVIDVMALQRDKSRNRQLDYIAAPGNSMATHYIFECGIKLNAQPSTIATATVLFHKFYKEVDKSNYDCYVSKL